MPDVTSVVTERTKPTQTVVLLMGTTVILAIVGEASTPKTSKITQALDPARIIIGGGVATVILSMLAKTGDAGRSFAMGLALLSLVTVGMTYGIPLSHTLSGVLTPPGAQPSVPTTTTTTTTKGTP